MGFAARGACRLVAVVGALCVLIGAQGAAAKPVKVVDRVKAAVGEKVTVFSNNDFRVTGECVDNGGGDFTADTFLRAKRNNLAYDTYSGDPPDPDFDRADGEVDITDGDASGTAPSLEAAEYYDFYAEGRNGRALNGRPVTGVHVKGADCAFWGTFVGSESKAGVHTPKRAKADAGERVTVFSNGDFRVTGECVDNGGGDFTADTFLKAKRKHLTYYLTELDLFDTNFGPGEVRVDITRPTDDASGTVPEFIGHSFNHDVWMESASGRVLQARVATGVHTKGADCTFSALVVGYGERGRLHLVERKKADAGERVNVFSNEDFRVTGECLDNGGGDFTADTRLAAKRNNLMYYAYDGDPFYLLDFDRADGRIDISDGSDATGTAPNYSAEDDYEDFFGDGRRGEMLVGRLGTGVHIKGADCTFSGVFIG